MNKTWQIISAVSLIPVGLVAAVLVHPLATGAEELTRWDTVAFGNKTAMYFMVLGGIGVVGGLYWGKLRSPLSRAGLVVGIGLALVLAAWRMSLQSPFDIALQ